ncbi:hypothetical protein [Enterococcus diestrammenae]|uniref:ABC transporter domain-containing protein n=1 Tax=Enterococcus diestrammenae TaxID=1155073 RepID=A0ABV0F7A0_9ENTE|nr:hypothetical protein [Enterococcus diestrammenae]KAF1296512.1 hypothetical protein BAU18_11930 [Enterococcus diestrammenae]
MIAEQKHKNQIRACYTTNPQALLTSFQQKKTQQLATFGIIHPDWLPIPYLGLKENILLGLSRKQRMEAQLTSTLKLVALPESIFAKTAAQLTQFETIQLQLLQQLLRGPQQLAFMEVSQGLSVNDIQLLLHLCLQMSRQLDVDILFITSDPFFAQAIQQMN